MLQNEGLKVLYVITLSALSKFLIINEIILKNLKPFQENVFSNMIFRA